jgi:uncharacterized protein YbjQ (UPF0145 family)
MEVPLLFIVLQLGIPILLIVVGYSMGRNAERKHFASIRKREFQFQNLPAVPTKQWDTDREVAHAWLVTGTVVVSTDYFKRLLAGLRNIVGGRMRSYESLLDRARREALLRLKKSCPQAHIIVNLRFETSAIASANRQGGVSAVELVVYGTAIRYRA